MREYLTKMRTVSANQCSEQVVGILLLYYPSFATEAIRRFTRLIRSVCKNSVLVIVENQEILHPDKNLPGTHIIAGDNTLHEFSGWQAGLEYCKQQKLISQYGVLIFANDTFCHHNKFGPISEWCFVHTFKKLMRTPEKLALAGEVQPYASILTIDEKKFSEWVSTYLFAMTVSLSQKIEPLTNPLDLERFFTHQINPENFLMGPINDNLKNHLANYLFGLRGSARWYASTSLTHDNLPRFISKTKSILCEMNLSATTISLGGELMPVFKNKLIQQARRLERLLPRYRHPTSVSK